MLAADVKAAGFKHALLLGMGGSSLCPEVLRMTFGKIPRLPGTARSRLHRILAQIRTIEKRSRRGEYPFYCVQQVRQHARAKYLKQYFFERVKQAVGEKESR